MHAHILDHIPAGLLETPAAGLYQLLPGPTLIHLPGRDPRPLFVSVLQHGNETTGWEAVRRLLKSRYRDNPLPRSLALFIGNVAAARRGRRHLDSQPDFNRCWPGSSLPETPWHRLFADYTAHIAALDPVASIDIHNNTGMNPHYAAVNHMDTRAFNLAAMFSRTCVYFTKPDGVQSMAFGEFCPSVTLECGQAGEIHGTDHAIAYLESCLQLDTLPEQPPAPDEIELFRMMATVRIPPELDFGFLPDHHALSLEENLDHMNFRELPPATRLGKINAPSSRYLLAIDHHGRDISDQYFVISDGYISTHKPLMPAMLTADVQVIRQDCLCYLMERIEISAPQSDRPGHPAPAPLPETRP